MIIFNINCLPVYDITYTLFTCPTSEFFKAFFFKINTFYFIFEKGSEKIHD